MGKQQKNQERNWQNEDNEAWDKEADRRREQHVLSMIEAGLAQASREERVLRLYRRYCDSGDEMILGELLEQTRAMTQKSVSDALKYHRFFKGNEEVRETSNEVSLNLMLLLREDYRKGIVRENILNLVRAYYKNRTLDMIRVKYRKHGWVYTPAKGVNSGEDIPIPPGWRPGNYAVTEESWDDMITDEDGDIRERIGELEPIHDPRAQLIEEKRALSGVLQQLYLTALMNYAKEPYKPIALCYTRILYHVERMFDPEEIQRAGEQLAARDDRKKMSGYEKMVTAFRTVQSTTTTTAPRWAMERMGSRTLLELAEDSQCSLQRNVDESLRWGDRFLAKLEEPSGMGDRKWKDIVLTETYTYKQITKLAESIHIAVFHAAQRRMQLEHPELMEEAVRLGFAFWNEGLPARKENTE